MNYQQIANDARKTVLRMIYKAQTSHIGSNLSCIDLLTVLYEKAYINKKDWENRDRILLSKGWAAASLYYFLYRKGLLSKKGLNSYCQEDSNLIGLAEPVAPGIEFAGGSMGHGLPAAVGMALAAKRLGKKYNVYCVMSDGELNCGTTWESLLIARHHNLDNLMVIIDDNGWQAMGRTSEVLGTHIPVEYVFIDGHDFKELDIILDQQWWVHHKGPRVVCASTIKGKGVSFMEDELVWHYQNINPRQYRQAMKELNEH